VPDGLTLGQRAEAQWQVVRQKFPGKYADVTLADTQTLLHDLEVHQIELEMQNEELRQSKDALDASRERYLDLYDMAPVGYCSVNEVGLITQSNLTLATLLGLARSALVRQPPFTKFVFHPDQDNWHRLRAQLLQSGLTHTLELRLRRNQGPASIDADAAFVWVQLVATVGQDESGRQLLHIAVTDINARKQAQAKQMDSEARWKFAINGDGDGLWDWNLQTGQAFFSPRYKEMLGYADADMGTTSDEWRKRIHPDDAPGVLATLQPYLDGKPGTLCVEFRMLRKDGLWQWTLGRGMVVEHDAQGKPLRMIGTHSDISQRRNADKNLRQALAATEKANDSKSRFVAAASHDLRQPMAALALYAGMLGAAVKPGQEMLVSHLQCCIDSLSGMLKDLLDVSKLDAGVLEPTISNFSMDSFGASLMTIYDAKAADKGLQLRWRHDAHITVSTDRQMLHRLIGNLIDNALAYTDQGGVLVATRRRAGVLWLEVWDTGVGMAQDQIPVIFEEFRQLGDNARNRGSGLGLAIVIKMAKLLGLEIRVRSRLGRGSVFSIALPEGDTLVPVPQPTPTAVPALIIGLVEDNRQVLDALVMTLEVLGHTVFAGTSGAELLDQLGEKVPDVVISDFRLGQGETGVDVIAAARARFGPNLPVIILTGDSDPNLVSGFGKEVAVLIKPIQIKEVQAALVQATRLRPTSAA
jgi:PAS domain S-box-containing protein